MRRVAFWLILFLGALSFSVALAQPLPQPNVTILVNRDGVNVRVAPALGADVLGFVSAGWTAPATGRSPDGEWVRIDFNGQEAWVGVPVINVISGDFNTLPVADPRSIPYGGFESPRSGATTATSAITGRLALSGLRLRAGPSTAYPVLANPPRYTVFPLLGRTASNGWLQVNYEGTLGWLVTEWVEIQGGASILALPVDGIVASSPPLSEDTLNNYIGTLRLMLSRLDLAQPSLDSIRGTWTTVALGQRAACQNFPARPTDINIANPVLAANFPTLEPLRVDFNSAMGAVRLAIDLWIEACGQPQPPSGVIGEATVIGALNSVQSADTLFADLRRRLNELIPPDVEIGADQCLFTFDEQFDVLRRINVNTSVPDALSPRKTAIGYCFDATAGQAITFRLAMLKFNAPILMFVSPFDNPTNFLVTGRSSAGVDSITLGPFIVPATGRYLLVIAATEFPAEGALAVDYFVQIKDASSLLCLVTPGNLELVLGLLVPGFSDLVNGYQCLTELAIAQNSGLTGVAAAAAVPSCARLVAEQFPLIGVALTVNDLITAVSNSCASSPTSGLPGVVVPTVTPLAGTTICPGTAFTCSQLFSCQEAQACLGAGNFSLDPDNDGIPCEETLCR
jgi:uncharacterized protein YraI